MLVPGAKPILNSQMMIKRPQTIYNASNPASENAPHTHGRDAMWVPRTPPHTGRSSRSAGFGGTVCAVTETVSDSWFGA